MIFCYENIKIKNGDFVVLRIKLRTTVIAANGFSYAAPLPDLAGLS